MTSTDAPAPPAQLRELFNIAVELPPEARAAWLDQHASDAQTRAALERLLQADDQDQGYLDTPVDQQAHRLCEPERFKPESLIGQQFGAFRLVRTLGQGGMATVFLGERVANDFEQQSAIKVLRRGLYSEFEQRLFQREKQVLATLHHPNIARLFDGGVTAAGIPYLVMEYIDGQPITQYANAKALGLQARLRLFLTATRAVEAAHRAMIVHRDIKPSNILVANDGTLKLLDFGIAKLMDEEATGATRTIGVFTPEYAAPEQKAGGTITTATDVYGLGVLLHELLLGARPALPLSRRPFSQGTPRQGETTLRPVRRMHADLDNILLKALAADAECRYHTAGELAADIIHLLEGRPVLAHPPSRWYIAQKFLQRNRGVVVACTALLLSIVGGLGASLWQAQQAREQAAISQREADRANAVREFLAALFEDVDIPGRDGEPPLVAQLLDAADKRVQADPMPPTTRADLMITLARVAYASGNRLVAKRLSTQAEQLVMQARPGDAMALLEARIARIEPLTRQEPLQALAMLEPWLPTIRAVENKITARAMAVASNVLNMNGRQAEAIEMSELSMGRHRRVFGPQSREALTVAFGLGPVYMSADRPADAERAYLAAIRDWRAAGLVTDINLPNALADLAGLYRDSGRPLAAEQSLREAIQLSRSSHALPPSQLPDLLSDLGPLLVIQGRYAESGAALREAGELRLRLFGPDSLETGYQHFLIGTLAATLRRFDDAEALFRNGIEQFKRRGFVGSPAFASMLSRLADVKLSRGDVAAANALNREALAQAVKTLGPKHSAVAPVLAVQSLIELQRGNSTQALTDIRGALRIYATTGEPLQEASIRAHQHYARILHALHRDAEALREIDAMLVSHRQHYGSLLPVARGMVLKAQILAALGRLAEARAVAGEASALSVPPTLLSPDELTALQRLRGAGT